MHHRHRLPGDGPPGALILPPHARYIQTRSGNPLPQPSHSLKTRSPEARCANFGVILALCPRAVVPLAVRARICTEAQRCSASGIL
jgi:hypothetical protein